MRLGDPARVQHIIDAAQEAVAFAQGQTVETLEADRMRVLALTRLIEIVGEATAAITPSLKATHPVLPWRSMSAMRNHLIHAYFDVDLAVVLDTAQNNLPPLIPALQAIITQEGWDTRPSP